MLQSELFMNTQKYAPRAFDMLFSSDRMSPERRAAYFEACNALYRGRSGDAMFFGATRHRRFAEYLNTERGWGRLERLASRIYNRGAWAAEEAARVARQRRSELERVSALRQNVERELRDQERRLETWTTRRRDAALELARCQTEQDCSRTKAEEARAALRDLDLQLRSLGPGMGAAS